MSDINIFYTALPEASDQSKRSRLDGSTPRPHAGQHQAEDCSVPHREGRLLAVPPGTGARVSIVLLAAYLFCVCEL